MNLESSVPEGRRRSLCARQLAESISAFCALAIAADLLGVGRLQQAAAAPASPEASAPAFLGAAAGDVGFDELPHLLAIEPADGSVDAPLDGVLRFTFDAPIDPESLGYLSVNLVEQGVQSVVGRLSVDGAVVTFAPIRSLLLDCNTASLREGAARESDGSPRWGALRSRGA